MDKNLTSKPDKKVVDMENTNPQDDIKISTFVKSMQTGVRIPTDLDYKKAQGDHLVEKH
ncbi:hypothetical protein EV198_1630 [Roseivirga ehrenbergii]|nr:hypothetical protein [Roseivirga ehrenbergii]TCL10600.1 hypothetical protein EV198_1630 [Roseivirga ehrenbergii]